MNNIFYVYAYLDPRKPGTYTYGDFEFDHAPFYIGKGKDRRMYDHLFDVLNGSAAPSEKNHKINKIVTMGTKPIIIKVVDELTNDDAYEVEKVLISLIGRTVDGSGILTNIYEGGTGGPRPEKTKEKLRAANVGKTIPEEVKAKISESLKGREFSEETRAKLSASLKGRIITPEARAKISAAKLGTTSSEETKAKISKSLKGVMAGEKHPMYGKHWTPDRIEKANESRRLYVWYIVLPSGEVTIVKNLVGFCEEVGIPNSSFRKAVKNETYYRGYLAFRFPKEEVIG